MYNLDSQFQFINEESLFKLAVWLRQKFSACEEKLQEAVKRVNASDCSEEVLQQEWEAQVAAQMKPLPSASPICFSFEAVTHNGRID